MRPGCTSTTGEGVRGVHNDKYHLPLNVEDGRGDISCDGKDDRISKGYHPICRAVSFDEEEIEMAATPAITIASGLRRHPSTNNQRQKVSILQQRMQQLRVHLEGIKGDHKRVAALPNWTNWTESPIAYTKGDQSRRSTSISRQRMKKRIAHHRKKGII